MSVYDEENMYRYSGLNPDAPNTRGYECGKCGSVPTEREVDNGSCRCCAEQRRLERLTAAGDK